jgi:SAM-dependent MidA family methyltransferase
MHECLFGEAGYYTSGKVDFKEHFVTYPAKSPVFGWTLAKYAIQLYESMGRPSEFTILEQGSGNGDLAKTMLDYIKLKDPEMYAKIRYQIEEISLALIERQKEKTQSHENITWKNKSAVEPGEDLEGLIITNELPDAFPVEVVNNVDGKIKQRYVQIDGEGNCQEIYLEPTNEVKEYLTDHNIQLQPEVSIPINLLASQWMQNLNLRLKRGSIVTIDYKKPYDEIKGSNEPIRCFGRINGEKISRDTKIQRETIYSHPSEVDLTSDVNFDVLENICSQNGFTTTFNSMQTNLLISLGIKEVVEESICLFDKLDSNNYKGFYNGFLLSNNGHYRSDGFHAQIVSKGVNIDLDQEEFESYDCKLFYRNEVIRVFYDGDTPIPEKIDKFPYCVEINHPYFRNPKKRIKFFKAQEDGDLEKLVYGGDLTLFERIQSQRELLIDLNPKTLKPSDFKGFEMAFSAKKPSEKFPRSI